MNGRNTSRFDVPYRLDGPQAVVGATCAVLCLVDAHYNSSGMYCSALESTNTKASIVVSIRKIRTPLSEKVIKRLHASRKSEMRFEEKRDKTRYLKLGEHVETLELFLKNLVSGIAMYKVAVRLILKSEHPVDLSRYAKRIVDLMGLIGLNFIIRNPLRKDDVRSFFPPYTTNDTAYMMDSVSIGSLMPLHFESVPISGGILIGVDDLTEKPVMLQTFAGNSFNILLFGESGSGKSFLSKLIMRRSLITCTANHILVIDPLNEYGAVSLGRETQIVNLGKGDYVDPLRTSTENEGVIDAVLSMLAHYDSSVTENASSLKRDIADYIRTTTYRDLKGLLQYLKEKEKNYPGVKALEDIIHSVFLNEVVPEIHSAVIIFKVPQFVDRSNESTVISVLITILSLISSLPGKKIINIDEAHNFINNEECSVLLDMITRHSRHYQTSVMSLTQNPDDFFLNQRARSILLNSSQIFGFRTKSKNISDYEISGIEAFKGIDFGNLMGGGKDPYSECFYYSSNRMRKLRVLCTEREKLSIDG